MADFVDTSARNKFLREFFDLPPNTPENQILSEIQKKDNLSKQDIIYLFDFLNCHTIAKKVGSL